MIDSGLGSNTSAYPSKWETDTVLSDGHTVAIRPIRSSDASLIQALHARLSPESIYLRFFSPLPHLTERMLTRFVNVDYVDRLALVALLGNDLIAVARYDRISGGGTAEVAFLVDDAHQGRGLATLMLEFLVEAAKEAGIHRFLADTLPENARMLRVFREAGFSDSRSFQDGVVRVVFDIDPTLESVKNMESRERIAVARSMGHIIAPKSIAVIGASRDPYSVGNVIFRNLLESNFQGPVYPVNTASPFVSSVKAYKTISEIPDEIDLAIVAIPAAQIQGFIEEAAEKQVGGLVIISSGFSDTSEEGAKVERDLVRQARRNGMRVVGGASMGVANTDPKISLNATLATYGITPGRAGLISHSGALGLAIVEEARRRGIGLSSFVSSGNRADVSSNDMLHYWEVDENTDVILLYLESFGNPRTFARVARRVGRSKPIVAVKARRYGDLPASISTNTSNSRNRQGPMSTPRGRIISAIPVDVAVDALMKYTGVIRVDSLEQLFEVGHALVTQPLPSGRRVAILSNRGGPAPLAQDACEAAGLGMATLDPATIEGLRRLNPTGRLTNPVELAPEVDPTGYGKALEVLINDAGVDAIIVLYIPTVVGPIAPLQVPFEAAKITENAIVVSAPGIDSARAVARSIAEASQQTLRSDPKPVLANFLALPGVPIELRRFTRAIPSFAFPEMAAIVLSQMAEYQAWKCQENGELPEVASTERKDAAKLIRAALSKLQSIPECSRGDNSSSNWLNDSDSFKLLAYYGISNIDHIANNNTSGFEASVALDLSVTHDHVFGPFISVGIAGPLADFLDAMTYATLPLFGNDIPKFIRSIPAVGLINGTGGQQTHDLASLGRLFAAVSLLVNDNYEISNIEARIISTPTATYVAEIEIRVTDWSPMPMTTTRSLR